MDFSISHRVTGIIKSKNTRENVSLYFRDSWSIEPEFQQKNILWEKFNFGYVPDRG